MQAVDAQRRVEFAVWQSEGGPEVEVLHVLGGSVLPDMSVDGADCRGKVPVTWQNGLHHDAGIRQGASQGVQNGLEVADNVFVGPAPAEIIGSDPDHDGVGPQLNHLFELGNHLVGGVAAYGQIVHVVLGKPFVPPTIRNEAVAQKNERN